MTHDGISADDAAQESRGAPPIRGLRMRGIPHPRLKPSAAGAVYLSPAFQRWERVCFSRESLQGRHMTPLSLDMLSLFGDEHGDADRLQVVLSPVIPRPMRNLVIAVLLLPGVLFAQQTAVAKQPQSKCGSVTATVNSADVIAIAVVGGVAQSPGFWSGYEPAKQQVAYIPDEWLKGNFGITEKLGTFTVEHLVVHGTPTADDNQPRLNQSLFSKGKKLILFLQTRTVRMDDGSNKIVTYPVSAECGVMEATEYNVAQVKAALNTLQTQ